jgi:glyoxylase-like metal-dependent hydrolase (beta-lactamase superfamily II)
MATIDIIDATVRVETFRASDGGCLGYLVVDAASGAAMAVDPRLDEVDRFIEALRARGASLIYALDTHTHADHLSGVRRLAKKTDATILAHIASKLRIAARRVRGGEAFKLGNALVTVLDAPGHTPDSLALLVDAHLFTGDALFAGGAGRTDFVGGSASDLFDTFRRFEALPDGTVVHPGHDYVGRPVTTIGEEKAQNELLRERDRAALVARMSVRAPSPANMAAILRHNLGEADTASITPREAEYLLTQRPMPFLLDVRSRLEFEGERIDGARNIPLDDLSARLDEMPTLTPVILVCRTGVRATTAAEVLGRAGLRTHVIEGGMNAWRRAYLPVREGRKRLAVDRQVQLIAGLMILTGVTLGAFVNSWFLALAAFFGAGLTFAGATGTCGLALLLMKMPWNRPSSPPTEGTAGTCAVDGGAGAVCQVSTTDPPR